LRDCVFDSCDFTGCRFTGTNLPGSSFIGCKFDYASFERTNVNVDILSSGCPGTENLTEKFARSLRINFQQLGDSEAVNRAIGLELSAKKIHLEKAWSSSESYYRKKYSGLKRLEMLSKWLWFVFEHKLWGNGESVYKLSRSVLIVLLLMSPIDIYLDHGKSFQFVGSYAEALSESFQVFVGVYYPEFHSKLYLAGLVLLRLIACGLLISITTVRLQVEQIQLVAIIA
jgi:hypothetical protein